MELLATAVSWLIIHQQFIKKKISESFRTKRSEEIKLDAYEALASQ